MEIEFKMPDLATTDSTIKVIRWLVGVGQPITRGQPLLEVETDKATMEVESIATGWLKETRAQTGASLCAGQLLAVIESNLTGCDPLVAPATAAPSLLEPIVDLEQRPIGGMFAKNRAAAGHAPVAEGRRTQAMSGVQSTAARRLQVSKQTIPHFYVQTSANAEPMLQRRAVPGGSAIAWDAFFVYAVGRALQKFERLSYRLEADQFVPAGTDAIGVAVDHGGDLYVVPIAGPAEKSPEAISLELRSLVGQVQAGAPGARRLGSTVLTVTNLGSTGAESFAAIINPPEAAILAVGRVVPVPVVRDGNIISQHRVNLTLSADHRIVSGKYAATFLDEIVREIEML